MAPTKKASSTQYGKKLRTACVSCTFLWLSITLSMSTVFAGIPGPTSPTDPETMKNMEERWGVRVESLRVSAAGNTLDFRYRIVDPEKAAYLVDRRNKPYMIDQASGKVLSVPTTAKVGPMRQTVRAGLPKKNKVYFILFGNPHVIKPGDRVTVAIGDFKVENMIVE